MSIKKFVVIVCLFLSQFDSFAQDKFNSLIIERGFGISAKYTFQQANILCVGPNYCIGIEKDKYTRGVHFNSLELLYSRVNMDGNYYNGISGGFNYNYTSLKGIGFNTSLHCLAYSRNTFLTPSIGVSYLGFLILEYGYSFKLTQEFDNTIKTPHQIGIKIFLNKSLFLLFRMV